MVKYDIYITGTIGMDIDAEYIRYRLEQLADQPVNVLVQSLGGEFNTALAVYAMFREHGDVNVHFTAMNASAATILAMGAKHISMDEEALILVHKARVPVVECDWLKADDIKTLVERLTRAAENLDTIDDVITAIYAKKTGKEPVELAQLMEEEKWLKADEARELNLVDEITREQKIKNQIVNAGWPLPPNKEDKQSLLDKLKNLFTTKNMNEKKTTNINLDNLAVVIGQVSLMSDGCAHLDATQLGAIDTALRQLNDNNGQLACRNEQLEQRVKELEQAPANEETKQVIENKCTEQKPCDGLAAYHQAAQAARKLFDSI